MERGGAALRWRRPGIRRRSARSGPGNPRGRNRAPAARTRAAGAPASCRRRRTRRSSLLDQIIGLDDRRRERIGRAGADIAAALRPLLPGGDRHAGLVLELALHAFLVARRREGELQVGALGASRRSARSSRPCVGDSDRMPLAASWPISAPRPQPEAARALVDGLDVLDARDEARRVVILQALADARQRMAHLDAERAAAAPASRRPTVAAAAANCRCRRTRITSLAARTSTGVPPRAALDVAHADRALALEDDVGGMRMRAHMRGSAASCAGCRNAVAALTRRPFWMVRWA